MIDRLCNGDFTKREQAMNMSYWLALETLDWWRQKDEYERKVQEEAIRNQRT